MNDSQVIAKALGQDLTHDEGYQLTYSYINIGNKLIESLLFYFVKNSDKIKPIGEQDISFATGLENIVERVPLLL